MNSLDVVLDCIVFDLQSSGGISRYWVNLIAGLAALPSGPRLHLLINEDARSESALKVVNLARTHPRLALHPYRARSLERVRQPAVPAHLAGRAVFHSSYYRTARHMPNVLTIHDFTYEDVVGGWRAAAQHWQKSQSISRSATVVCVSESTRRDFKRRFPEHRRPVEVIHHGVEEAFRTAPSSPAVSAPAAADRSGRTLPDAVLFVGRRDGYKNFWQAVGAVGRSNDLQLTIVGPALTAAERTRLDAELRGRYTVRAQADDAELIRLYRSAFALVYPSEYEGFGLPVLEAMACGCPAIALGVSSIPEVAGDGAILLERASPECIADALDRIRVGDVRQRIIERGLAQAARFSWAQSAARYLAVYAAVCGQP